MALVCDIKSDTQQQQQNPEIPVNEDLEDGEIEDDDEEEVVEEQPAPEQPSSEPAIDQPPPTASPIKFPPQQQQRPSRFDRHRYDERKRGHLTEAEKSVMHLHKIERLEREKRDRYKREQTSTVDDFASNIEKAIANVLRKDKKRSDDEKEDEDNKRGKKRKRKDKDKKKAKQQKSPPKPEDIVDESEMLNVRGASPQQKQNQSRSPTPHSDYDSYESSASSDGRDRKRRDKRKTNKKRNREQKSEPQLKDAQGVCLFYLQGKCTKESSCPYSHEISQPIKLELCKFYLMGCCAKGENCHYMHSEFPCKFYHTGLSCYAGDTCKFAHGKPLEEGLRQILFKHIETAPKEILGDFPRLSREGALSMINQAQKALEAKYGVESAADGDKSSIPSLFELNIPVPAELLQKDDAKAKEKNEKPRNRPSRWQDPDPIDNSDAKPNQMHLTFGLKGFYSERGDQDMRVNSNGDIDMRTLPPRLNLDTDIRDTDIRLNQVDFSKDIDIRQIPQFTNDDNDNMADEPNLEIDEDKTEAKSAPAHLPKKQRELFLRIKAQQKDNLPDTPKEASDEDTNNIDWYSDDDDDDDDGRLTIRDDVEDAVKPKVEEPEPVVAQPLQIKPVEVIEKLGDLSKIDISAEVTKMLLSSISQSGVLNKESKAVSPRDPRTAAQTDAKPALVAGDPRRSRVGSTETKKPEKLSIYDQGCISLDHSSKDVDLRAVEDLDLRPKFGDTDLRTPPPTSGGRPDIDLRQLGLPFKAMQNYTPASEIDASVNSHVPITWRVHLVEIPRPDYTGLKLSPHEAQNTGDPRLRKIFRLNSTEEKDSPASPKETAKPPAPTTPTVRIDPRRRKMEEKPTVENPSMSYSQQLNVLQTSAFYQSLTSNQKVLLNQELSSKHDNNDQTLNGILSNLGLLSGPSTIIPNTSALNILANINSLNPMITQTPNMVVSNQPFINQNVNPNVVNQMAQSIVQPGLLGAAPGVPNLPADFQLNFDPRQGGLLGNAPNFNYNENQNYNFNEEYYEEGNNFIESNRGGRGNRGGFRDRQHQRRGRSFNNRNAGGRNFRNRNRNNNRSRTPP